MEKQTEAVLPNEVSSPKKSGNVLVIGAVLILIAIFALKLFSQNKGTDTPLQELTPTQTTAPEVTPVDVANGAISVEAGSFYYKPNIIRVKKDEKVKITLNSVSMMHDFVIDELGIKIPITKSGESSTVEFLASKEGEFEFYCSVGNHRAMGQVGKLIVTK